MTMLMSDSHVPDGPCPAARLTFPCSSSQLRCWFVDAVSPGNPALNVALRWELKGTVARSTVQRAFDLIVERHEILRTRIVDPDGMPEQEVMSGVRLVVDEVDLAEVPAEVRVAQALERARAEARRPFDLAAAPLLRVTLVRLAPDHAFLFVTVHQIAFDGWSIRLLSTEFAAIARALHAGVPPDLPELPMQYGDYAAWQKAYLDSGTFDTERAYWRRQLAGVPFFEVPGDRERPPRPTSHCEIVATHVPPAVSDAMMRVVKQQHVTLFSFGCAVMATALRHFTGAEDIAIGTQVSGRDDPDLDPLIGVFINNLVLRFDLSRDPTFVERLDSVNGTIQDALVHQRMPFHALVDLLKPPRDPRRMPLISVNFTVLQDVMDDARCGDFELLGQPSLSAGSLYDLNFFLVHWPATGWRMALEYNTDLFAPTTAAQLLELWSTLLRVAAERPGFRLSELGLPPRVRPGAVAAGEDAVVAAAPAIPGGMPAAVAPPAAGDVVQTLTAIWTDLLGVPDIGPGSDFFALGGHSLLALRMLARAEAALGRKVRLSDLLPDPTIAGLAASLAGGAVPAGTQPAGGDGPAPAADRSPPRPWAGNWRIVEVRGPGAETTIFGIDTVTELYEFWEETGGDRGLVSIQLFEPGRPHEFGRKSFEEIAADYLALIRQVQPAGPYRLFGLCVHGVLAYEIAQQMRRAGDEVELLAFKSAWHPSYFARLSRLNRWSIRLSHLAGSAVLVLRGRKGLFEALANYSVVRRTGLLELAVRLGLLDEVPPKTGSRFNDEALLALMAARDAYAPKPYDGRVLQHIGPDAPRGRGFDPSLGWAGTITGPLTIRDMAADGRISDLAGQRPATGAAFQRPVASRPMVR